MQIKFDTEVPLNLAPLGVNIQTIQQELENLVGMKFGNGQLVSQFLGMLYAALHNPDIKRNKAVLDKVLTYTAIGLCEAFAKQLGAQIYLAQETQEMMVFVPTSDTEGSAMRIDKHFNQWLKTNEWDFPKSIEKATILTTQ